MSQQRDPRIFELPEELSDTILHWHQMLEREEGEALAAALFYGYAARWSQYLNPWSEPKLPRDGLPERALREAEATVRQIEALHALPVKDVQRMTSMKLRFLGMPVVRGRFEAPRLLVFVPEDDDLGLEDDGERRGPRHQA